VRFPGLEDGTAYRAKILASAGGPGQSPLAWANEDVVLTGRSLGTIGMRPPVQFPQQSTVIEFTAER
jgi:alpha-galactosidase